MQQLVFRWPVMIALCFLFFPVGIWLIVKRIQWEPRRQTANATILRNFGFVLLGMAAFAVVGLLTGAGALDVEGLLGLGIMLAGGVIAVQQGVRLLAQDRRFARYTAAITTEGERSLDRLATASATTAEVAAADLQSMIRRGLLPDGYLDMNARRLVLPEAPAAPEKAVTCPHCGGVTHVAEGSAATCDYCGSPLN